MIKVVKTKEHQITNLKLERMSISCKSFLEKTGSSETSKVELTLLPSA